jgi:ketosteroid isomerase-like protein
MDRIAALYDAFNARDIDTVIAQFAPDVDWPDAWHGGRVVGHDAVRAYWLGQWYGTGTATSSDVPSSCTPTRSAAR